MSRNRDSSSVIFQKKESSIWLWKTLNTSVAITVPLTFEGPRANVAPLSGESLEPKLSFENPFDCHLRRVEVLRNNSCSRKRKLLKEIEKSFP
jgi:hypothetical protein